MIYKDVSIVDRSLKKKNNTKYNLSIQLKSDGLSFSIHEKGNNIVVAIIEYLFSEAYSPDQIYSSIESTFTDLSNLKLNFSNVLASINNKRSLLLPEEYMSETSVKRFMDFQVGIDDYDEIHAHFIPGYNQKLVYGVPSEISNICLQFFPQTKFISPVLPYFKESIFTPEQRSFVIHVISNTVYLIAIAEQQILYFNVLDFIDENDFTFAVFSALKQIKYDLLTTQVIVCGEIDFDGTLFGLLKRFVKNDIKTLQVSQSFIKSDKFNKVSLPRYFGLLNFSSCEL